MGCFYCYYTLVSLLISGLNWMGDYMVENGENPGKRGRPEGQGGAPGGTVQKIEYLFTPIIPAFIFTLVQVKNTTLTIIFFNPTHKLIFIPVQYSHSYLILP